MKPRHHKLTGSLSHGRLLRGGIALGSVAALATASVATAAPGHASHAQAQSDIAFRIQQPARSSANITFESGLSNITNQAATGTSMLAFIASTDGFIVTANAANNGEDLIHGDTTPGESITGDAIIPVGATVTASVNGGPETAIPNGAFTIPISASLGAAHPATRPSSTVSVSPRAVPAGRRATSYAVAVRYDGTLGPVAWLRVRAR
jgi:hypothetical protein